MGLKGVACIADDILVYGNSESDHDENLSNLLEVCTKTNIKLNLDKSVFKTTEVEFLGHLVTNKGLKLDFKKVEAILGIWKTLLMLMEFEGCKRCPQYPPPPLLGSAPLGKA